LWTCVQSGTIENDMERTDSGILIAFEGIDGAGKTTQVGLLSEFFRDTGEPFVSSKEPTDGPWGKKIRQSATNGRLSPADELHALTEDRKEHVHNLICPALKEGKTVILDRYFYSTIAYQGTQPGQSAENIAKTMFDIAVEPDVVIVIDVPPEIGLYRIRHTRGDTPNAFETEDHLATVREAFDRISNKYKNVIKIDGLKDIEGVRREIITKLIFGVLKKRYCAKDYGCDQPEYCSYRITGTCRWAKMCKHAGLHPL
jgi:dTMP kinase